MTDQNFFFTISKSSIAEFRDRGSRFIAYTYPITRKEEFKSILAGLKKEHPKAAHHCFAYRIGTKGLEYRVSDDGEPSGSAGRTILGQIDSKQLVNVLVIVVRYFGGTLLGVPGLINAYKTCSANALSESSIIQKPVLVSYKLEFDYTLMNDVMKIIRATDAIIAEQQAQLFCLLTVDIPKNRSAEFSDRVSKIFGVSVLKG